MQVKIAGFLSKRGIFTTQHGTVKKLLSAVLVLTAALCVGCSGDKYAVYAYDDGWFYGEFATPERPQEPEHEQEKLITADGKEYKLDFVRNSFDVYQQRWESKYSAVIQTDDTFAMIEAIYCGDELKHLYFPFSPGDRTLEEAAGALAAERADISKCSLTADSKDGFTVYSFMCPAQEGEVKRYYRLSLSDSTASWSSVVDTSGLLTEQQESRIDLSACDAAVDKAMQNAYINREDITLKSWEYTRAVSVTESGRMTVAYRVKAEFDSVSLGQHSDLLILRVDTGMTV